MLRLSDLLGSAVHGPEGDVAGRLVDVAVEVGEEHPPVRHLAIGRRRRIDAVVRWEAVVAFDSDRIVISTSRGDGAASAEAEGLGERELLLARDVLDTQVVDVAGKRLARVSEVLLSRVDQDVRVVAVDVGAAGLWRRLGMSRFADRATAEPVDWADLHLTSTRGHDLQLAVPGAGVHRRTPSELAAVVAHLTTASAAQVIHTVPPAVAAAALSASHPRVSARLLTALPRSATSSVVAHMPLDDAAAALRNLPDEALDAVLGDIGSERAAGLQRLLAHPADTAGGLMNPDVLTAEVGEPVESIRDRVAAAVPELAGLATVFVVDSGGRPIGCFEPTDLLAGRGPRRVPSVPVTMPVQQVIDLFTLHDYLALPVVGADGRLLGLVAIDDILDELLAERLPGQGRYARVRRRAQQLGVRRQGAGRRSAQQGS